MKRYLTVCVILLLCFTLACAAKTETAEQTPETVFAPNALELTLTLPLGARDDAAKTIPAYTAGFTAKDGGALTFTVASADPSVAEGVLRDDGTLYVIAHGVGETKLAVTAKNETGGTGEATVSVKVRDARRMLALLVLGVLSVALLVLLGQPSQKKTESAGEEPKEPAAGEEPKEPAVIFEEPNDNPERS